MYQKFETLGAGVRDMLNKNMWMLNAANILNTAKESGYERAMNSVFGSAVGMERISIFGFDCT